VQVSAIIPAYNEAKTIVPTLKSLRRVEEIGEIIVVDDGSRDGTPELADRIADRVLRLKENRGKGEAVWWGSRSAVYPVLALLDADLGFSAGEVKKLIPPVLKEEVDMTVAIFPENRKGKGFGLVKKMAKTGIKVFTGNCYQAPLSGQRVLRKEVFQRMQIPPRGFGLEIALSLAAFRQGYRVKEINVNMYHREKGRNLDGLLHRGRQMVAVVRELVRETVWR